MPQRWDMFGVVSASVDRVVLRVIRSCDAQALCDALGLSRRVQQRVFAQGHLTRLNGEVLARGSALRAAEDVALRLVETRVPGPTSDGPVEVLWYDRFAVAANKPRGLLVHGDGTGADTLTARVQARVTRAARDQGWPFVPVVQALNRLDVETSGIVLFSQTEEFQPAFDVLVASHAPDGVRKRYLAIVEGAFEGAPRVIDRPVARDRHDARRMRVGSAGREGKEAQTVVACLDQRDGRSLVACELRSGRRHQIRVHLASEGHPVVGDPMYGTASEGGLMLHAWELWLMHPVANDPLLLRTEWPERFAGLFSSREVDWSILET